MRKILLICLLIFTGCKYKSYHISGESPTYNPNYHKKPNIALVLSGAGSKGIVHAGVIAAFVDSNIPIDLIVGSSAGSLVGLLYADSKNVTKVKNILMNSDISDFLRFSPINHFFNATLFSHPADLNKFNAFLDKNIAAQNFEDLKIPLAVVTTDITNNKSQIYNSGKINPSVLASCAIPGLYQPVYFDGKYHVDGGVISPVPTTEAKLSNPQLVVAVNLVGKPPKEKIKGNLSMLYRATWITYYELSQTQTVNSDLQLIIDTSKYDWLDNLSSEDKEKLYQEGYNEAKKLIKKNISLFR